MCAQRVCLHHRYRAVLWPNAHAGTMLRDLRMDHEGEEVRSGTKYTWSSFHPPFPINGGLVAG